MSDSILPSLSQSSKAAHLQTISHQRKHLSFTQQLKLLRVNAIHYLNDHSNAILSQQKSADDLTSYTFDVMQYWQTHNSTVQYRRLHRNLLPYTRTLADILFYKAKILEILVQEVTNLRKEHHEAVLDIIWVLSRELRSEFVTFFLPSLLSPLISKIDLKESNASMMETLFRTLMLMFRFLYPYMIRELHTYFVVYERLLAHGNVHVRGFAAESFAFLLQKMNREQFIADQRGEDRMEVDNEDDDEDAVAPPSDQKDNMLFKFLDFIFDRLCDKNSETLYDGISLLFFHSIKGVVGNFRTGVSYFIGALLTKHREALEAQYSSAETNSDSTHTAALFLLLKKVLKKLTSYAQSKEVAQPLWKSLHSHFDACKSLLRGDNTTLFSVCHKHIIGFTHTLANSPSKIDEAILSDMLQYWLSEQIIQLHDEQTFLLLLNMVQALNARFDGATLRSQHSHYSQIPWNNVELYKNPRPLFHLFLSGAQLQNTEALFAHEDIINYVTPHLIGAEHTDESLSFLLMYRQVASFTLTSQIFEHIHNTIQEEFSRLYVKDSAEDRTRIIGCLSLLNYVASHKQRENLEKMHREHTNKLLRRMKERYGSRTEEGSAPQLSFPSTHGEQKSHISSLLDRDQVVASQYIRALELIHCTQAAPTVVELFLHFGAHHEVIQQAHSYFDTCARKLNQSMEEFLLSVQLSKEKICNSGVLHKNISSFNDQSRLNMIRMLIHSGFSDENEKKILKHMLRSEEHGQNFHTMRDRQAELQRIISLMSSHDFSSQFNRIVLMWQLGTMWVKINLSETHAQVLEAIAEKDGATFWSVVFPHVQKSFEFFSVERDFDTEHKDEMTPIVYTSSGRHDNVENQINASAYDKYFSLPEHFFQLSHTVRSDSFDMHLNVTQYFNNLWRSFITRNSLFHEHSEEVMNFFDAFYAYGFKHLEQERIKRIGEKSFVGQFLHDFLLAFQHVDVQRLEKHRVFFLNLVCTTNSPIQIATTQVLRTMDVKWLAPHIGLVMGVLKSRSSTKPLEKFKMRSIPAEHAVPLMRFLTRATLPLLDTKKTQEKAKRRQHEAVVRFLGKCHDKHVIAAIIEELFMPLVSLGKRGTTLDVSPVSYIMEHPEELKRALSITGVILRHSFSGSAFMQYFDVMLRLISGPLQLRLQHYKEQLALKLASADEMQDDVDIHKKNGADEIQDEENAAGDDTTSEAAADDENHLQYMAQEAHRLTNLAFQRYPDAHYSKELLQFHMDNSVFIFTEYVPQFPHSLPVVARVSFAFFSMAELSGALLYKDFIKSFLRGLEVSEGETSKLLLAALGDLVKMQSATVGEHTGSLFSKRLHAEQTVGEVLIQPNVDELMRVLYSVGQRSSDAIVALCTSIAKLMLPHFSNTTPADAVLFFFGITIPKNATMEDEEVALVLDLFKRFVPLATAEVQVKFINYISNLLLTAADSSIRLAVCDIFDQIAVTVPAIAPVAALLRSFEARDRRKVSNEDVTSQLAAIQSVKSDSAFAEFTDLQWMPIACSLMHKLNRSKEELKDACVHAVSHILVSIPESNTVDLVTEIVLSVIASKHITTSCVHAKLLRTLTEVQPQFEVIRGKLTTFYDSLASASSKNKVAAITEFQQTFSTWYKKTEPCAHLVISVFLPIFLRLLKVSGDKMSSVSQASHDAIQLMSATVDKATYKVMYKKLLDQITSKDTTENTHLMNLLVVMTGRFTGGKKVSVSTSMTTFFMEKVVKALRNVVFAKKGHMQLARLELVQLIVEIVSVFAEPDKKRNIINKIVRDLVGKLNSKENLQRNKSREVLVAVVKLLHHEQFLCMAVKNASHVLVDGFQRDVFLTTALELMNMAVSEEIPVDSTIQVLLPTLFRDMKRESEKISTKNKVEKKQDYNFGTIYELVRAMGRGMKVERSLDAVVTQVHNLTKDVHQKDILSRFNTIYSQLVNGLANNNSLTDAFLVQYCLGKFDECSLYNAEFQFNHTHSKKPMKKAKFAHLEILPEPVRRGYISADMQQSSLVIGIQHDVFLVRFLVQLIASGLKQANSLNTESRGFSMLFDSLVKYASGTDEDLALASLQCLLTMRKQNVTIAVKNQNKILDVILSLLRTSGVDTRGENWQILFNALHYFMHKVKFQFNDAYLSLILEILQLELTSQRDENMNAYLLVKGMIDSKTMLPQMYDLSKSCRTTLITTLRLDIQSLCVHILKNFLIYYPMEPNVLQDHLNFIFQNIMNTSLSIEARQGLGEMIHTIITRFPVEYLQEKIEYIVCPVAVQICNEQNAQCKEKLQDAMLALLDRIDAAAFAVVMKLVRKWLKSEKLGLVGFQVMKIASKVNNCATLNNYLTDPKFNLWKRVLIQLNTIPSSVEAVQVMSDRDAAVAHEILCILEAMFRAQYVKANESVMIWPVFKVLLVHPSVHVRFEALQVVHTFFSKYSKSSDVMRQENELVALGLLLLENLMSVNLEDNMAHLVRKVFLQVFQNLVKFHLKKLQAVDASDETDAEEIGGDELLNGASVVILMRRLRTFFMQSSRTKDADTVKKLRLKTIIHLFESVCEKHTTKIASCVGFFTPTLYVLYEETKEKSSDLAVQAEDCISTLKDKLGDAFAPRYTQGRTYMLNRRAAKKDTVAAEYMTDQQEFAKKKLQKRRRTTESRKEKSKRVKLA